jgi:hypothetical protein
MLNSNPRKQKHTFPSCVDDFKPAGVRASAILPITLITRIYLVGNVKRFKRLPNHTTQTCSEEECFLVLSSIRSRRKFPLVQLWVAKLVVDRALLK